MLDTARVIAFAFAGWVAINVAVRLFVVPWLRRQCAGDAVAGGLWLVLRGYCGMVHRAAWTGHESIRMQGGTAELDRARGPLIVVSNHTAGLDPLLIQTGCRFRIRWMMAADMMVPALEWLWRRERVIPVHFDGRDAAAAREAMRHLEAGGVLGVFPEGGIARPPGTIQPFLPGVGLIVARTQAPVLLTLVTDTPARDRAFESLLIPSRSKVRYLELIRYPEGTKASIIIEDLAQRLAAASGWPRVARRAAVEGTVEGPVEGPVATDAVGATR